MHWRSLLLCALTACAGHHATQQPAEHPEPVTKAAPPAESSASPRALSEHATFGELVRVAQSLDTAAAGHSSKGCLLRLTAPARLEADLALAARPLPDPVVHSDDAISEVLGPVAVMSSWGNVPGEAEAGLLVAFTTTSPAAVKLPAVALFATQRGVLLRAADAGIRAHPEVMTRDQAGVLLAALPGPATIYATADRDLDLHALLAALELVPNRFEIALAVALPKGTQLPAAAPVDPSALCPAGLPAPAGSEREGDLSSAAAQQAVTPLREAALSCALNAGGRALLGGRLVLALRIGADGRARETCFVADEIGEAALRRCLLSAARDLPFPRPNPAGFADLQVPLQLSLAGPSPQRARCE